MNSYLRHLANFAHVVNAGSITSAAQRQGVSPSGMSDSVRIVEGLAGEPLLERTRAGVRLLPSGEIIFEEANGIVLSLARIGDRVRTESLSGEVRISLPMECATSWLGTLLPKIARSAPEVQPVILAEDEQITRNIHSRDLYVRVGLSSARSGLNVLHQIEASAILVASASLAEGFDPTDPASVSEQRFICAPEARNNPVLPLAKPRGGQLTFRATLPVNDISTRIELARAGAGLTCCIGWTAAQEIRDGRLVQVLPGQFGIRLSLTVGTPDRRVPARVAHVANELADHVRGLPTLPA